MQQQSTVQTNVPPMNNQYPGPRVVYTMGVPMAAAPYYPPAPVTYLDRQSKGLGATQIIIGILCIIFNIVAIALAPIGVSAVGHGFWCGILVSNYATFVI